MINQSKFYVSVFFSFLSFFSISSLAKDDCSNLSSLIEVKRVSFEKQIESIHFLIEQKGKPQLPLEVIFQIDLNNPDQIKRRENEVRNLSDLSNVMKSQEISDLNQCIPTQVQQSQINALAQQYVQLNSLKLIFFKFSHEKKVILIDKYKSQRSLDADKNAVDQEIQKVTFELQRAQNMLNQTSQALEGDSSKVNEEDFAIAAAELQQYLADYAHEHLAFLNVINDKKRSLEIIRLKVNELIQKEQSGHFEAKNLLQEANESWENSVDFIPGLFKGLEVSTRVSLPEPFPPKNSFTTEQSQQYSDYIKSYQEAKKNRLEQTNKKTQIVNELRSQAFQLLTDAGQLRSRLFSNCDKLKNCNDHRGINSKNLSDFTREIEIIPTKIQAGGIAKTLELQGKFTAGLDGWIDLFQQVVALFILILIPLFLLKILNWLNLKLDSTRRSILNRSMMDFRRRTSLALWISRVNPFVPATGMVIGIWLARNIIETTDLKEISQFLFYFQLYFIYRIFKLFIQISLEVLFSSESVGDFNKQKIRTENSAKRISRLIFLELALLFLIETTARRALLYGLISTLIFYFNVVFIFWEAYRWRREIFESYSDRFSSHDDYTAKIQNSKFLTFLVSPVLMIAVVLRDIILKTYSFLIRLDFFKKINSEIFRRRIEADAEEEVKVTPDDIYLRQFDYYLPADQSILIDKDNSQLNNILSVMNLWRNNQTTEDLILIVGNRGMGKTTLLESISKTLNEDIQVFKPSPKTIDSVGFYNFLSSIFKSEVNSIDSFIELESGLQSRKIVLIDDIQNLFLGQIGGFEAYKIFIEILSLKTKNIFWCLSINSRSWSYLKGSFGDEHLYGKIFRLNSWKDYEIQELVLKRHEKTEFSRYFDKSIKAYGATGDTLGQQAETQFFRLLWGQSRGNPRSALMYWISAVSQTDVQQITVGVPSFIDSSLVSTMSDDSLFLLASIARHESLTQYEMQIVTNIQNNIIRKCMKEALDKSLVWVDPYGRYRISSRAQYVIDYFLIGKNFLYE